MTNITEVKKNLFKVKKVIVSKKDRNGNVTSTIEHIGIVRPYFRVTSHTFDSDYISILSLDGVFDCFNIEDIEFKTTRITNDKIKKEVEQLINRCKSKHKLELEEEKLYNDFNAQINKLKEKSAKNNDEVNEILKRIENTKGFIPIEDLVQRLNKDLSITLKSGYIPESSYFYEFFYGLEIEKYTLYVGFMKEKISRLVLSYNKDICRRVSPNGYDFIYEDYDRTLYIDNLNNSKDFERLKEEHFSKYLDLPYNYGVKQKFDADIGVKDTLIINRTLEMPLELERIEENYKDVCDKIKYFLSLI